MSLGACPPTQGSFNIGTVENYTFTGGIAMDVATIVIDPTTKRIRNIDQWVQTLKTQNKVPMFPIMIPGKNQIDITAQVAADNAFLIRVKDEYCAYQQRYDFTLREFLNRSTSTTPDQVTSAAQYLTASENLNKKINSILEILNFLNSSRVNILNGQLNTDIKALNIDINTKTQEIGQQYALLSRNNAVIETQNQMLVYTKEKNEYVLNQIGLFTILNAFAIGSIFAIWRILK